MSDFVKLFAEREKGWNPYRECTDPDPARKKGHLAHAPRRLFRLRSKAKQNIWLPFEER
jgi:hypothetical protein